MFRRKEFYKKLNKLSEKTFVNFSKRFTKKLWRNILKNYGETEKKFLEKVE
jgi:hypothetical protein